MTKKVLIVEDNELNMKLFHDLLEAHGIDTIKCNNGLEVLNIAREGKPDLILMDISMPEMDGLSASRAIRAHEAAHGLPSCPIHALTALAAAEDETVCRAAGIDGVLTKPLSRADLYALITRIAGQADYEPAPAHGRRRRSRGAGHG